MKKRSMIATAFLGLALSFGFVSCSDDDEGFDGIEYQSQGYIKGEITGVSEDASYVFEDDFNYKDYSLLLNTISTYEKNDDNSYEVDLRRSDYGDYGSATISFDLANADAEPENISISVTWAEEEKNKIITFDMDSNDGENSVSITDFSFNPETGRAKGKFSMNGDANSTDNNALVTGSFDVVAKPVVQ
jgi:hypothetical protein